jgi:hypothetical protein
MGSPSQTAIYEKMSTQLSTFVKVGDQANIFTSPGAKALRGAIVGWLPKMTDANSPISVSELRKTKIAPHLALFGATHEMVATLSLLFQGWGRIRHLEVEIEAATGPLLVGEDEAQDEQKLRAWQPTFVKMFGAAALPAELHDGPVKKQLAAHLVSREALPGTTDGQVYRAAQTNMTALRAEGLGYWKRMHALLDAEFGMGKEGFASKSMFGYDLRLRPGPSKKKRAGETSPADEKADGKAAPVDGAESKKAEAPA